MTTFPKPFQLSNVPNSSGSPLRVPFGLKAGRAWAPGEVAKGKACGCVCPGCQAPLAAKASGSRRRRPHFAHLAGGDCKTGRETGIHLLAKQIIADHLRLFLPAWDGCPPAMPNPPRGWDLDRAVHLGTRVHLPARLAKLTSAELERPMEGYVPDVFARDEEGDLLIEIRVTHAVGEEKAERVTSDGWRMLEIDLSGIDRDLPHHPEAFERAVLEDPAIRHWVCHPQAVARWQDSQAALEAWLSKRNAQIEAARTAAQEAARAEQERAVAEEQQKVTRREFMRQRERKPYLDALARLNELTDPVRVAALNQALQAEAAPRVQELAAAVEPAVRYACMGSHKHAWIYGTDPALWQLLATHQFVTGREPGWQFNQRELAAWVRSSFPYDRDLYRLFAAQYAKRAEARRAGFAKRHLTFWAFTEQENFRIPDFYAPVNHLVDKWVAAGLVIRLAEPIGQCQVCEPLSSRRGAISVSGVAGSEHVLPRHTEAAP